MASITEIKSETIAVAPNNIIDGNAIAAVVREEVKKETESLIKNHGIVPGLAVVLVGTRKDSETYVRMKKKVCI